MASTRFAAALEEARGSGRVLLDLTESDPARCGLGWEQEELDGILRRRRSVAPAVVISEAREAVAGYLAGHGAAVAPHRVIPVASRKGALRLALDAVCGRDGEAVVPVPHRPLVESGSSVRLRRYRLVFEERWRLDRRSIQRAIAATTRAIVVGNPADPTGAQLSREELGFLDHLCDARNIALVADESFLDSSLEPGPSIAAAGRRLTVHVSGLGGICGLLQLDAAWVAVGGPEALAAPLASRLATLAGAADAGPRPACCSLPRCSGAASPFSRACAVGSPGTAPRWRAPPCARRPGRCSGAAAGGQCSR